MKVKILNWNSPYNKEGFIDIANLWASPDGMYAVIERFRAELFVSAQIIEDSTDGYICDFVREYSSYYSLVFKKGCNVGGLQHEPMNRHSGTTFHFSMDPEVFSETIIPESFFINTLTNIAILSPGLTCIYINSGTGHKRKFHFPLGIADYLKQTMNCAEISLFKACIYASGRDRYNRPEYQADLEIAIGFSEYGSSEKYLHNFRTIRHGGLHVNFIQDRVCRIINDCFHDEIWSSATCASNNDITYGELKDHIHIAVTTFCPSRFSLWESGAQQSLVNPMIADMAYDAVSGKLWAYVHNNRRALLPMINTIIEKRNITDN